MLVLSPHEKGERFTDWVRFIAAVKQKSGNQRSSLEFRTDFKIDNPWKKQEKKLKRSNEVSRLEYKIRR